MSWQRELPLTNSGEARGGQRCEEAPTAANDTECSGTSDLMERVVSRPNLQAALKRVKQNKGGPGSDGMTVDELSDHLRNHWPRIREELLAGQYRPAVVKQQEIPKAGGGVRKLGIPTVLDRFIQQALLQVLQPRFDPTFSPHSYGYRPGKRAHDAVRTAQRYIQEGRSWVVDVDLEAFFDRVHHDVLMGKLADRIADRRVLRLIRHYLEVGIMAHGVVMERHEGTPQGGPLSPLLANLLLDEVDQELARRGHAFVRYADDCNVYVQSQRAGERVMKLLRRLFTKLRLEINEAKSAVARVWSRKLLGYSFWDVLGRAVKRRVSAKSLTALKDKVRTITKRNRGRSIRHVVDELREYLVGWKNYYQLADTPRIFADLDGWIRHRLRALHLKHWGRGRATYRELRARGAPDHVARIVARYTRRWWRNAAMYLQTVLTTRYFDQLGLPRLAT